MSEVKVFGFLDTSLVSNLVGTRVDTKFKRAKIKLSQNEGPRQVQNNLIVADRNQLLKDFFNQPETVESK